MVKFLAFGSGMTNKRSRYILSNENNWFSIVLVVRLNNYCT